MHLHAKLIGLNMKKMRKKGIHEDNLFHQRKYVGTFSFHLYLITLLSHKCCKKNVAIHFNSPHCYCTTQQRLLWYTDRITSMQLTTQVTQLFLNIGQTTSRCMEDFLLRYQTKLVIPHTISFNNGPSLCSLT